MQTLELKLATLTMHQFPVAHSVMAVLLRLVLAAWTCIYTATRTLVEAPDLWLKHAVIKTLL